MRTKKKNKIDKEEILEGALIIGAVLIFTFGLCGISSYFIDTGKELFIGSYVEKKENLVSLDFSEDNGSKKVIIETKNRAAAINTNKIKFKTSTNSNHDYIKYKQNKDENFAADSKDYVIYLTENSAEKYSKEYAKKIKETMVIREK